MSSDPFLRDTTSVHRRPTRRAATDDDAADIRAHPLLVEPWPETSPRGDGAWRSGRRGTDAMWGLTLALAFPSILIVALAWPDDSPSTAFVQTIAVYSAVMAACMPSLMLTRLAALRRVAVQRILPAASTRRLVDDALPALGKLLLAWVLMTAVVAGAGTETARSLKATGAPWPSVDRLIADADSVGRYLAWILVALVVNRQEVVS